MFLHLLASYHSYSERLTSRLEADCGVSDQSVNQPVSLQDENQSAHRL